MAAQLETIADQLKQVVAEAKSSGTRIRIEPSPQVLDTSPKKSTLDKPEVSPSTRNVTFDPKSTAASEQNGALSPGTGEEKHTMRGAKGDHQKKSVDNRGVLAMEDFTFKPARNRKSAELLAGKGPKFAPLHEPKPIKEPAVAAEAVIAASPMINPRSQVIAANLGRHGPIHDRLLQSDNLRQKKIEEMTQEMNRKEQEAMTGTPHIDKHSEEILRRKAATSSDIPEDTVKRLAEYEIKRREERRKTLEEQYQAQLRRATETFSYISPVSKRMVEKSELEGKPLGTRANLNSSKASPDAKLATCRSPNTNDPAPEKKADPHQKSPPLSVATELTSQAAAVRTTSPGRTPRQRPLSAGSSIATKRSASPGKALVTARSFSAVTKPANGDKSTHTDSSASRDAAGSATTTKSSHVPAHVNSAKAVVPKAPKNVHSNGIMDAQEASKDATPDAVESLRAYYMKVMEDKEAQCRRELAIAAAESERENRTCALLRQDNENILSENIRMREYCEDLLAETETLKQSNNRFNVELEMLSKINEKLGLELEMITEKSHAVIRLNDQLMTQVQKCAVRESKRNPSS